MNRLLALFALLLPLLFAAAPAYGVMLRAEKSAVPDFFWPSQLASGDEPPCSQDCTMDAAIYGYDFAEDVRVGPNLYAYVKQNPWTKFDPDGLEGVVVSGQPGDHKNKEHFLINGLDRAAKMAKEFKDSGTKESVKWMVYNDGGKGGFSQKLLDSYQKRAEKAGVDFEVVSSAKKISEYVNDKTGGDSRSKDKVSRFSYIGHATPGDLDVGFVDHGTWNMMTNDSIKPSRDFKPGAFSEKSKINLVGGCRTDVADWVSDSAADQFRNSIVGKDSTVSGSTSRVYYPGGVVSDAQLPKPEGGTVKSSPGRYDPGASAAAAERAARETFPVNRAVE